MRLHPSRFDFVLGILSSLALTARTLQTFQSILEPRCHLLLGCTFVNMPDLIPILARNMATLFGGCVIASSQTRLFIIQLSLHATFAVFLFLFFCKRNNFRHCYSVQEKQFLRKEIVGSMINQKAWRMEYILISILSFSSNIIPDIIKLDYIIPQCHCEITLQSPSTSPFILLFPIRQLLLLPLPNHLLHSKLCSYNFHTYHSS